MVLYIVIKEQFDIEQKINIDFPFDRVLSGRNEI